jgi:hypothetical protein
MVLACGQKTITCRGNEIEQPLFEQRLWVAVLAQALEDWHGDRLRSKREAEHFLFEDQKDFEIVCAGAGIEASSLRSQLCRVRATRNSARPLLVA